MSRVLSTAQLKRLNEHKYSAEGVSILEPLMQKFWRWLVEQIPTTWAPNTITSVGLIINVVTTLILVLYSPDAKQEVSIVHGLCHSFPSQKQSADFIFKGGNCAYTGVIRHNKIVITFNVLLF